MILLDPDLDPYPAPHGRRPVHGSPYPSPKSTTAKHDAGSSEPTIPAHRRVPSAPSLARFLTVAQAAVRLRGHVTVLLTSDTVIRKLNRQFRGKNKATDVLSFPAAGPVAPQVAGDLAISVPTALRQAAEQGHTLAVEIKVLMLHGLLHLAGYDHEVDAGRMARRERLLRSRLGLPQGLIERAGEPVRETHKKKTRSGARQ